MKLISAYFLFLLSPVCMAQPKTELPAKEFCSNPKIEWLEEISSGSIRTSSGGFLESVYDLIFGSNDLTILKPFNLVTNSKGSLFFVDQDSKKIIKYSFAENEIESLLDDDVKLKSPVGLCINETDLVFTDSEINAVIKYNFDTEQTSILNSSLEQPTGIIYLENIQEFWICETKLHRIARLNKNGKLIGTIGQRGIEQGQFNFPTFIWADKNGNIYVNDSMNFRIQVFSEQGKFIKQFGKSGDGSGDFARAKGIATDYFNNIYVVDALFNNVQVFDQSGSLLYSFGQRGTDSEMFWLPVGIFIDSQNKIFIADSFNSRIQIFQLSCEN